MLVHLFLHHLSVVFKVLMHQLLHLVPSLQLPRHMLNLTIVDVLHCQVQRQNRILAKHNIKWTVLGSNMYCAV